MKSEAHRKERAGCFRVIDLLALWAAHLHTVKAIYLANYALLHAL